VTTRAPRDSPFCWQAKEALRRIRGWFDESNVASALAVYLALSEAESNAGAAGPFVATQSDIAKRAGVGQRTARTIFVGLQACQLLKVTANFHDGGQFRAPSTYELLRSAPSGNGCHTIGNNFLTCGNERLRRQLPGNTRKREESTKESSEEIRLTDQQRRLAAIFNRRITTRWSPRELEAFNKAQPIDDEELALIEQRYRAERLKSDSTCRHDLQTLLNNFPSEVDRATLWKEQQRSQDEAVAKPQFAHEHYREVSLA
jgi:hypothetical protein